jgi:hypothetical protein
VPIEAKISVNATGYAGWLARTEGSAGDDAGWNNQFRDRATNVAPRSQLTWMLKERPTWMLKERPTWILKERPTWMLKEREPFRRAERGYMPTMCLASFSLSRQK